MMPVFPWLTAFRNTSQWWFEAVQRGRKETRAKQNNINGNLVINSMSFWKQMNGNKSASEGKCTDLPQNCCLFLQQNNKSRAKWHYFKVIFGKLRIDEEERKHREQGGGLGPGSSLTSSVTCTLSSLLSNVLFLSGLLGGYIKWDWEQWNSTKCKVTIAFYHHTEYTKDLNIAIKIVHVSYNLWFEWQFYIESLLDFQI
jgi:hypothetical protein